MLSSKGLEGDQGKECEVNIQKIYLLILNYTS